MEIEKEGKVSGIWNLSKNEWGDMELKLNKKVKGDMELKQEGQVTGIVELRWKEKKRDI